MTLTKKKKKKKKNDDNPIRNHKTKWTKKQNNTLLLSFFSGMRPQGVKGSGFLLRRVPNAVTSQLRKLFTRYRPHLCRFDIGVCRSGKPWVEVDYLVLRGAASKRGRAQGANDHAYIAKLLGRTKQEVDIRLEQMTKDQIPPLLKQWTNESLWNLIEELCLRRTKRIRQFLTENDLDCRLLQLFTSKQRRGVFDDE